MKKKIIFFLTMGTDMIGYNKKIFSDLEYIIMLFNDYLESKDSGFIKKIKDAFDEFLLLENNEYLKLNEYHYDDLCNHLELIKLIRDEEEERKWGNKLKETNYYNQINLSSYKKENTQEVLIEGKKELKEMTVFIDETPVEDDMNKTKKKAEKKETDIINLPSRKTPELMSNDISKKLQDQIDFLMESIRCNQKEKIKQDRKFKRYQDITSQKLLKLEKYYDYLILRESISSYKMIGEIRMKKINLSNKEFLMHILQDPNLAQYFYMYESYFSDKKILNEMVHSPLHNIQLKHWLN